MTCIEAIRLLRVAGASGYCTERAGAPAADLKTLEAEAETTQTGVELAAIKPQGVADAAAKLVDGPALTQRRLKGVQGMADVVDHGAGAAQIERAGAAVVAIAEAIVWAVGLGTAAAQASGDASLLGEEFRPGGQEGQGWMGVLVHKRLIFQFRARWKRGTGTSRPWFSAEFSRVCSEPVPFFNGLLGIVRTAGVWDGWDRWGRQNGWDRQECLSSCDGRGESGQRGGGGAGQGLGDEAELDEEFGRLALGRDQVQVAVDHLLGVIQDGSQAGGVDDDFGEAGLIADLEPEEVDERQPDGALEFVGCIDDELPVGGDDDARDGLADGLGQVIPAVARGQPRRQGVGVGWRGVVGRLGFGAALCTHVQ